MVAGNYEGVDFLSDLSRKTTAYHDAPVDQMEDAREEYMEALRNFNSAQDGPDSAANSTGPWQAPNGIF